MYHDGMHFIYDLQNTRSATETYQMYTKYYANHKIYGHRIHRRKLRELGLGGITPQIFPYLIS